LKKEGLEVGVQLQNNWKIKSLFVSKEAWIESKKTYSGIAIIWVQMGGTFSLDIFLKEKVTINCFVLVYFHGWSRKWHERKKVEEESDSCLS
jgi:hypothetical protein